MGVPTRAEFEATWAELHLGDEAATKLATDATITPHTLALLRGEPPPGDGGAADQQLPRLSVRFPDAAGVTAPATRPGAELEVQHVLGEGGMGKVFLARQRSLQRDVAIKTLKPGASSAAARLLRSEAVITGHLEHPGVVPVHALGVDDDGRPVLVLKRIEGVCWLDLMRDPDHPAWRTVAQDGPESPLEWHTDVLIRLTDAVAFAHSRGYVHRDLKPENVMVGAFGEVYLVDWGLAVSSGTGSPRDSLVGTPAYMAPEMVDGRPVDERTDVYLLGAILHEILTGKPPHQGDSLHAVVFAAFLSEPHSFPEHVPAELAELCNRMLAHDPDARPASAQAVRSALVTHQRHRALSAIAEAAESRLQELVKCMQSEARQERDLTHLYRLRAEARFGFMQVLRDWPDNESAERGLQRCLEAAVELELARGDPETAGAFLAELPANRPELEAKVSALLTQRQSEAQERERAVALAREMDPRENQHKRLWVTVAVSPLLLGLAAFMQHLVRSEGGITFADAITVGVGLTVLFAAAAAWLLRGTDNVFTRRIAASVTLIPVALVLERVVGMQSHGSLMASMAADGVVMAAMLAIMAVWSLRWIWFASGCMAAGALIGAWAPDLAPWAFSLSGMSLPMLAILFWRSTR